MLAFLGTQGKGVRFVMPRFLFLLQKQLTQRKRSVARVFSAGSYIVLYCVVLLWNIKKAVPCLKTPVSLDVYRTHVYVVMPNFCRWNAVKALSCC